VCPWLSKVFCQDETLPCFALGSELSWVQPELTGAAPAARSLHTASLISDRLFIFGGWTSASKDIHITDSQQWSVTNDTACLNLSKYFTFVLTYSMDIANWPICVLQCRQ